MTTGNTKITRKFEIIFLTVVISVLVLSLIILFTSLQSDMLAPAPSPIPSATATITPTPTLTATVTLTPTSTITPTRTNTLTPIPSETPLPSPTPTAFAFDQGEFEQATVFEQVIPGVVNRFMVAEDGSIWLASPFAVGRYQINGRQFNQINLRDPIFALTHDGKAWILPNSGTPLTTWNGLLGESFDSGNGWTAPQGYGLPSPLPMQLSSDLVNELWLTTAYDIRRLQGSRWRVFQPTEIGFAMPFRRAYATSFVVSHSQISESTWAGSCDWSEGETAGGDGIRIFKDGRWDETGLPTRRGCVQALANDPQGNLWVAIERELWQYNERTGQWREFTPPALNQTQFIDYTHGNVANLLIAPDNSLFILYALCGAAGCDTRQILYQIEGGNWTALAAPSFLQPALFLFDGEDDLWAFTPRLITKLENGAFRPQAAIDWIGADVDVDGNVWVLSGELNGRMIAWRFVPD